MIRIYTRNYMTDLGSRPFKVIELFGWTIWRQKR